MSTHIEAKTHVQTASARQEAKHFHERFEEIVEPAIEKQIEGAVEELKGRYTWGEEIAGHKERFSYGDGFIAEIARLRDCTQEHVYQHIRFAEAVDTAFKGHEEPIEAYIQQCRDLGRDLSWNAARTWMGSQTEENEEGVTRLDEQMRKVEKIGSKLEEQAERLRALAEEHAGKMTEKRRKELQGVLTHVAEVLRDGLPGRIEPPEPLRSKPYRKHVVDQTCAVCPGKPAEDPHHLERKGTAKKESDALCVPLCREHHRQLGEIGEETFWEKHGVNPYRKVAFIQARFIDNAASYE